MVYFPVQCGFRAKQGKHRTIFVLALIVGAVMQAIGRVEYEKKQG